MSANPLNINLHFSRKSGLYRYTFNGQESLDPELNCAVSYDARTFNCNLAVFFSLDPLMLSAPYRSPYSFAELNPILFIDNLGENPIIGQIKTLPNGGISLRLTSGPRFSQYSYENKWDQDFLRHNLSRPVPNSKIAEKQFNLWVKDGFLGIADNDFTSNTIKNQGTVKFIGGVTFMYDIYKSYEMAEIEKLKREDIKRFKEYEYNIETVGYLVNETQWLMNSSYIAQKRGVFKNLDIEKHGKGFQIDLVNYSLLANTKMLEGNEQSILLEGDLCGLSREEYMGKLKNAFDALNKDVFNDFNESYQEINVRHSVDMGGRRIANFAATAIISKRSLSYVAEPARPKK